MIYCLSNSDDNLNDYYTFLRFSLFKAHKIPSFLFSGRGEDEECSIIYGIFAVEAKTFSIAFHTKSFFRELSARKIEWKWSKTVR
jgi:hypothetical protein